MRWTGMPVSRAATTEANEDGARSESEGAEETSASIRDTETAAAAAPLEPEGSTAHPPLLSSERNGN
jgi:hypothetical protein